MHEEDELVTVFETGDPGRMLMVKSVLDDAGIRFTTQGDALQDLFGVGRIGADFSTIVGPVRFLVLGGDAGAAHDLLADLAEEEHRANQQARSDDDLRDDQDPRTAEDPT